MRSKEAQRHPWNRYLPLAIGIAIMSGALWMWRSLSVQEEAAIRREVETQVSQVQSEMGLNVAMRVGGITLLGDIWQRTQAPAGEEWARAVTDAFTWSRGAESIAWLDAGHNVTWKAFNSISLPSPESPKALDANLGKAVEVIRALLKPEPRQPVVTSSFELTTGKSAIAVGGPLYRGGAFDGFLLVVHQVEGIVNWRGDQTVPAGLALSIVEGGAEIHKAQRAGSDDPRWAMDVPFNAPILNWTLRVSPTPDVVKSKTTPWSYVSLAGGGLLSVLLGLLVHLAQGMRQVSLQKKNSELLFRSIFDNAADPILIVDDEGCIVESNSSASLLYGLSQPELLGRIWHEFAAPAAEEREAIEWAALKQGRHRGLLRLTRPDGTVRDVEYSITASISPGSHLTIYRDVTDRTRYERELKESEDRYRDLFENASDLILMITPNGQLKYVNRAWEAALEYDSADLESLSVFTLIHPDFIPAFTEVFRKALRGERLEKIELEFLTKSGRKLTVEGALNCRSANGNAAFIRGIFRDVTERKALETELLRKNAELESRNETIQQASRMKSEFLANMSHELRTPLNAIVGFAEFLIDENAGPVTEEQRSCLDDLLNSGMHLLQLINDILDLSKIEAGKMEFHPEPVELPKLIGEVRDVLRSLSVRKNIGIDVSVDPRIQTVVADPSRFKQVLYNYLSNALKFTPAGGSITVSAVPEGRASFRIEVADTGIGIAPDDLKKLFTEFQQLDGGSSKRFQGTGLGLALTKRMVEAQGGEVSVRSTLGEGSVFGAVLPRAPKTAGDPPSRTEVPEGPSVLVIEDDRQDRRMLVRTLTEAGYAVETASNGAQAVARVRSRTYDFITLDLLLPDTSGWTILKEIRKGETNSDTPVIVVTLVAEQDTASGFPVHGFLSKPVVPDELLDSLRKTSRETATPHSLVLVGS